MLAYRLLLFFEVVLHGGTEYRGRATVELPPGRAVRREPSPCSPRQLEERVRHAHAVLGGCPGEDEYDDGGISGGTLDRPALHARIDARVERMVAAGLP